MKHLDKNNKAGASAQKLSNARLLPHALYRPQLLDALGSLTLIPVLQRVRRCSTMRQGRQTSMLLTSERSLLAFRAALVWSKAAGSSAHGATRPVVAAMLLALGARVCFAISWQYPKTKRTCRLLLRYSPGN